MTDVKQNGLIEKFQWLVETTDVARVLTEPLIASLKMLLQVTANELGSDEASVLVRDGHQGDLRFLCAIGQVADELLNIRIPSGKGVAGFVLSSGQPMAVSDAGGEQVFYPDVDKTTGFTTQTILAVPLNHGGEMIGVLEYVNRKGAPPFAPFTSDEMDRALHYSEAVASLVNAYESAKILRDLGGQVILGDKPVDTEEVRKWLAELRDSPEHRELIELAVLLREISKRGEAERSLCREVLESILRFSDNRGGAAYGGY